MAKVGHEGAFQRQTAAISLPQASRQSAGKQMLNASLLMANVSQLRSLLNATAVQDYFWRIDLAFVIISVTLQIGISILLLIIAIEKQKHVSHVSDVSVTCLRLRQVTTGLILAVTIINILIAVFDTTR